MKRIKLHPDRFHMFVLRRSGTPSYYSKSYDSLEQSLIHLHRRALYLRNAVFVCMGDCWSSPLVWANTGVDPHGGFRSQTAKELRLVARYIPQPAYVGKIPKKDHHLTTRRTHNSIPTQEQQEEMDSLDPHAVKALHTVLTNPTMLRRIMGDYYYETHMLKKQKPVKQS